MVFTGLGVWRLADALVRRDIVVGAGWAGVTAAAFLCMAGASFVFRKLEVARVAAVACADPVSVVECIHVAPETVSHAASVRLFLGRRIPWRLLIGRVLNVLEIGDECGGLRVGGQPVCAWQQRHSSREFGHEFVGWSVWATLELGARIRCSNTIKRCVRGCRTISTPSAPLFLVLSVCA